MTLPASGPISIADIATELGVGLPLSLTASNVRALAGVPSGNIVLPNDFWGKSASDPTLDPLDWSAVSGGSGAINTQQTISGIVGAVTLRMRTYFVIATGLAGGTLQAFVNGVEVQTLSITEDGQATFSVNNGDLVHFGGLVGGSPGDTLDCTVAITNDSNGGAAVDTFVVALVVA